MRRLLAVILLVMLFCLHDRVGGSAAQKDVPIDALVPAKTEMATFALG